MSRSTCMTRLDRQIGYRQFCHGVAARVKGASRHDARFHFPHHVRQVDAFMHHKSGNGRPVGIESQRGRQFVTGFPGGGNTDLVIAAIRPDGDLRPASGSFVDDVGRAFPVVANPCPEGLDGFIRSGCRVIPPVGAGWQHDSLRVALVSFMQVVRVGCQFDDAGIGHFPDLVPGEECGAGELLVTAVIDFFVVRRFQPARFQRQESGIAVGLQHGIGDFIKAAVSVIERNQHGFGRQVRIVFLRFQDVPDADDGIAVFFQPVEMFFQFRPGNRGRVIKHAAVQNGNHIVVAQGNE